MKFRDIRALVALAVSTFAFAGQARAESAAVDGGANATVRAAAVATTPQAAALADLARGFDMLRAGRQAQAVALFDRVIARLDPPAQGDARARFCGSQGAEAVHGAVTLDPAVCDAHFGRGFALIDLGRGDLAEAALRRATEMAPTNAHYANEYAELYKSRREWAESYRLFARAWSVADKTPGSPDASVAARALRGMGFNKMQLGDYDAAEELFRRSQAFEPDSLAAKAELGHLARRKAIGS